MDYLNRHFEMRCDPRLVVEGARTVVSAALNYFPARRQPADTLQFARYAYGKDYHEVVRGKLKSVMESLHLTGRAFCDTAPIDERYWAWRCGLGWLGRNAQLIIPRAGSFYFLGEMVIEQTVDHYNEPQCNRCGTCHNCYEACPTSALSREGHLDARRCLSYLTIENRDALPPDLAEKMEQCVYGCDRCLEACPWNRFATPNQTPELSPSDEFLAMLPDDWQNLTVEQYRRLFKGSAVKRAKYEGLLRNIKAVLKKTDE